MAQLVEASLFGTEHLVRIPTPAGDCIVVSGYASASATSTTSETFLVRMVVGPAWQSILDVAPVINIAGMFNQGANWNLRLFRCAWDKVPGQAAGTERIRLEAEVNVFAAGANTFAYHVIANGQLAPGVEI